MPSDKMPSRQRGLSTANRRRIPGQGVVLALGIWLMIVSVTWTYGNGDGWPDARWNDGLAGLGLTVTTLIGMARPSSPAIRAVTGLLGGWLIIAPFIAGYGFAADSTPATVNDVLAGTLIAFLAAFGRT